MRILLALAVLGGAPNAASPQEAKDWVSLFNGKDLSGWETWLGGKPPRGLNSDPDGVFSVVALDGSPAIRISGQALGGLATKDEYSDFHLRVEFKWGTLTHPPRKDLPRDSGIFYYAVGPHGAGGGSWMKSVQSSIMEKDYGAYWGVAGAIVDIEIGDERTAYDEDPKTKYPVYARGGRLTRFTEGVRPSPIPEPPAGTWIVAEIYSLNGTGVHVFQDQVTLVLRNARHAVDGKEVPLTKGKLMLQSEAAEIYFRNLRIRPLREFPARLREWVAPPK